jgi:hypothetical protein
MIMKNILDRVTENFNNKFKDLEFQLEQYKDWEVLKRTLNLRPQSCFNLFGRENKTLEEVQYIVGLFINCFLDDATMVISTRKEYSYEHHTFGYGGDDYIGIKESEILELLSLIERYEECYDENGKFIDNDRGKHYYSLIAAVDAKVAQLKQKQEETKWV